MVDPRPAEAEPKKVIAVRINEMHMYAPWGRSTSYRLVAEGRIPARKLGRSTLILVSDIEKFINNLEQVAA